VTGEVRITLLVAADHTQDINLELEARNLPCAHPQDHNDPKKRGKEMTITDKKSAIVADETKRREIDPEYDPKNFLPVYSADFKIKKKHS
jgi:hypothetical protein